MRRNHVTAIPHSFWSATVLVALFGAAFMLAGCGWSYPDDDPQAANPLAADTGANPSAETSAVDEEAFAIPDDAPTAARLETGEDWEGSGDDLIQDDDEPADRPSSGSRSDRELLEDVLRQQRERLSELEAASRWTLERARELVSNGQVGRAKTLLEDLLAELRRWQSPERPSLTSAANEVDAYYRQVLGLSGDSFQGANLDEQSDTMRSLIEEARAVARQRYEHAQELANHGSYQDALDEYYAVLEVIRWSPPGAGLEEQYESLVESRIRDTLDRQRDEQWRQRVEQEQLQRELEFLERRRQEDQRRETLEALWGEALFNMNLRRFSTAELICDQILALDPGFEEARSMKRTVEQARINTAHDQNLERKLDQFRRLWADWYDTKIPLAGRNIVYPTGDEWERIKNRAALLNTAIQDPPEVQRIKSVLNNTTADRLQFDETELQDVIDYVAQQSGLPVIIHPSIAEDIGEEEVSIDVGKLLWGNALQIICDLTETEYRIVPEGVVWIVNEDVEMEPPMVVRLHDVRDLTIRVRDFPGTRIRLRGNDTGTGGGGPGLIFEDDEELVEPIETDTLAEIIEEAVVPDSWDLETASITTVAGQLLVRNTAEVHAEIQRFLQDLRDVSGLVVTIEARFITVDDMFISEFGVDWRGLGGQSPGNTVLLDDVTVANPDLAGGTVDNGANAVPPGAAIAGLFFNNGTNTTTTDIRGRFENIFENALGNFLRSTGGLGLQYTIFNQPDMQFQLVINSLEKSRNATILVAPRLSAFNTQRANLTVINQVAYIRDFSVQTAVSAAIADPIIDTISDGLVLDIKPTVSNDRRFITIELRPSVAQLLRPIPEFITTLGAAGSTPVTIQIPELSVQSAETTVMCPDGGLVIVGGMKSIRDVDRESTTPLLGDIPIIGMLFRRKGRSLENRSLIIVVKAVVTDLREQESRLP